jgi:hypothetical protein
VLGGARIAEAKAQADLPKHVSGSCSLRTRRVPSAIDRMDGGR